MNPTDTKKTTRLKSNHGESGPFSINALSEMTGVDRRTLKKHLASVTPKKVEGVSKLYELADVEAALPKESQGGSLRDEKLREEIRKLRIKNDRDQGLVVPRARVAESISRILPTAMGQLEQKLVNEYPSAVAGLDVPQARVYGKRVFDDLAASLRAFEKEWA